MLYWEEAYDHFNVRLFNGDLPYVVFSIQRRTVKDSNWAEHKKNAYWSFEDKSNLPTRVRDEIMLNMTKMQTVDEKKGLAILVHEMCHVYQENLSGVEPKGKGDYHDLAFATIMEGKGLITSVTDKPGGARTGAPMGEYIVKGGPFDRAADEFIERKLTRWVVNPKVKARVHGN